MENRMPTAVDNDKQAVMNAAARFYAALNIFFTGEMGPMKEVWSHADDVNYMGPGGGLKVGWAEVLKDWETVAAMKIGGKVTPVDMQVVVGTDIAIVTNFENGENTNAKGEIVKVSIRATNIFRKEDGQWKMIGHHTDLLPWLEDAS